MTMINLLLLLLPLYSLIILFHSGDALRVKGSKSADNSEEPSLYYLARFGVARGHSFYVYGTAKQDPKRPAMNDSSLTLGLVSQKVWNSLMTATVLACNDRLFEEVLHTNLRGCTDDTYVDVIRTLPCVPGTCNQPSDVPVFHGYNFTYRVSNVQETEFFYLFFLTCEGNRTSCKWSKSTNASVTYEIHLVNNEPNHTNPYSNEFSYESNGVLTLHLFFTLSYIILITSHFLLHNRGLRRRRRYSVHLLIKLFSISLVLEGVYVLAELIHSSMFAANGGSIVVFRYLGEICNQVSDWFLILSVILVGKGWQVTTSSLRWSKVTVLIWTAYIVFSGIFFTWTVISEQYYPLSVGLYHGYQSWAGGVYLIYRLFILIYILYEMRQVYLIENRHTALQLYIILAVCYIIWFLYLPLLTVVAVAINPVRRGIVMTSVYLIFDLLINIGMVLLFCPFWAYKYFQFEHYINVLTQSSNCKSLKSYGGPETPTPI